MLHLVVTIPLLALAPMGSMDASVPETLATGRLIPAQPTVAPGEELLVGVSLRLSPGWHTYWKGLNDTGYPVSVSWTLPEGWTAGEIAWPAPERHVSPGDILDHVYHDQVTLLVPVRAAADAAPGPARIAAHVEYLVCHEVCIPGSTEVALDVTVVSEAGAVAELPAVLAAANRRVPRGLLDSDGIRWTWEERGLAISAPPADTLAFYPDLSCAPLVSPLQDGATDSGMLTLRLAESAGAPQAVSGVLEVRGSDPTPLFVQISIPLDE